jgi:hypothetical protein
VNEKGAMLLQVAPITNQGENAMGLISKFFSWGTHPLNDDSTIKQWLAGLLLILIVSFLWIQVVRQIET